METTEQLLRNNINERDEKIRKLERKCVICVEICIALVLLCFYLVYSLYHMNDRIKDLSEEVAYYQEKNIDG